ncbi:hypothetical protein SH580_06110 [Coraliomargarita algicola]|uniref:Uncharacterized protein n=1 Tax=Coraliomargarita algicola TaxID=3092156 RepID=A0ABZ0RR63_9BACT|nr:hypothetical protein [Coraliomargarita sp. J2-16]WPJ97280.1 hypothetical protein SH580_06110 [Coraliomargarita sp. J2-16]
MHPHRFSQLVVFLCFLSTLAVSAVAQSNESGLKFTCLMWDDLPMEDLHYKEGKSYKPITFRKGKRSQEYYFRNASVFELFVPAVNEEGERYFKLVGSSPLVEGTQQILFIVVPLERKPDMPLSILALDDSLEGFPPGSFRFANFTGSKLLVKVRDEVTQLETGKITVTDAQSSEDGGMVPVAFGSPAGELLHFTRIYSHARSREMVFILRSQDLRKKFDFKFVPQNMPKAQKFAE